MGICYIFAAGDFCGNICRNKDDLIIAADAGYHHLERLCIVPDLLLGDFDTIGNVPKVCDIMKFNPEKDYTDTELAIIEGINRGYSNFVICGAVGGKRLEHTVANLKLASSYAFRGYDITMTDGDYIIKALHNGKIEFSEKEKGFVSIFALDGKVSGLTIKGLKYELDNAILDENCPTLCVSNEFVGKNAEISVNCGVILIMYNGKEYSIED